MSEKQPSNRHAHENVQARNDAFDDFERECLILDDDARTRPSLVVAAYADWSRASGRRDLSRIEVREQIKRRGWEIYKTKGSDTVRGIGLRDSVALPGSATDRPRTPTLAQIMERLDSMAAEQNAMAADLAAIRAAVCPELPGAE